MTTETESGEQLTALPFSELRHSLFKDLKGKPTAIYVLALTPTYLTKHEEVLVQALGDGAHLKVVLAGGLATLAWNDRKVKILEKFDDLEKFRTKLRDQGLDHQLEIRERDWVSSVGMVVLDCGQESRAMVSIYTPDPNAPAKDKTVLLLSKTETPLLLQFYRHQFLSLWADSIPVRRTIERSRQLRQVATRRVASLLRNLEHVKFGFVIALSEEFQAFLRVMGEYSVERDPETGMRSYLFTLSEGTTLKHRCVAVLVGRMGHTAIAQTVERIVGYYGVEVVISIGIAGGTSSDVGVGDIVVASQVNCYLENGKATNGHPTFELNLGGQSLQTTHHLQDDSLHMQFAHREIFERWQKDCEENARHVLGEVGVIKAPTDDVSILLYKQLAQGNAPLLATDAAVRHPRVHLKPTLIANDPHIASGPIVGATSTFVSWLKQAGDRKVVALEMEAGGLVTAAHLRLNPAKTLVIRAISDLADSEKSGLEDLFGSSLRRIAMENATILVKLMIKGGLLTTPHDNDLEEPYSHRQL